MKIYFAGSIRGGRDDAGIYAEIIEELLNYGEVLTEHIGKKDLSDKGEALPLQEIFSRDVNWIRQADVLVAEVTNPSIGVGYEIGVAESLGKKILCLFRNVADKKVSGMILGNNDIFKKEYKDIEEVRRILKEFFT